MTPSRIRALTILWATLGGAMIAALPVLGIAVALGIGPERIFGAATIGVRNVSIPFLEKTIASGIDLTFGYIAVNGSVTALLWFFVARVRRHDPTRGAHFRRSDPTLVLFRFVPAFRRIREKQLQPLFVGLVAVPFSAPTLLGAVFAAVVLAGVQPEKLLATAVIAFGMLAPHAIFELTAVFLPLSVLLAMYLDTRSDLEGGRLDAVWTTIRASTTLASLKRPLLLSAGLVVLAAVIEAHFTMPIVHFLEEIWA